MWETFEKTHKEWCRERIRSYTDKEVKEDIREQVRQQVYLLLQPHVLSSLHQQMEARGTTRGRI